MPETPSDNPSPRQLLPDSMADPIRAAYQTNLFLRTALDQASEGIMILQPEVDDGLGPKIAFCNARMAALVGTDPQSGLRGRFVTQLVETKGEALELLEALRHAAANGGASQWEGDIRTLFGSKRQRCLWRIRAVQDDHANLLNFTVVLTLANAGHTSLSAKPAPVLEEGDARRLRNDNLATMSLGVLHDLNNLLGIIMTNLSVAREGEEAMGSTTLLHIEESLAAAQQAREFITQTMRMAKDMPEQRDPTDISALIRATSRVAQSGSGVNLHLSLPKDLWWSVVDKAQMTQVMQNLILNGIQAMNNVGYMDVIARNVVVPRDHGLLPQGPHVEILVRDRGCGMSPDVLARILKESFTTKENGNGIGLATCKRVVEEHTGKLHISSMKDIGTEITFWLPATEPRLTQVEKKSRAALQKGAGNILIVDDEPRLRQIMVTVLKQCGYRVFEASGGEEAVQAYRHLMRHQDEVDLVIMDLTLKGGLTGEDAMREIKSFHPEARIIASSGGLVAETRPAFIKAGFCDILPKPFLAPDISEVVFRHLMAHKAQPEASTKAIAA